MLKDIVEVFKIQRERYLAKDSGHTKISFITDSYGLGKGDYLLIDYASGEMIEYLSVTDKTPKDSVYEIFAKMDYLSVLIDMNKPVDTKKVIHSNNLYSFFIKKESLGTKLTPAIVEDYYTNLSNLALKYKNDKKKTELFLEVEGKYGKTDTAEIEKIRNWITQNLLTEEILKKIPDYKLDKGYLKIFFNLPFEKYEKECFKYLIPNLYNSCEYNLKKDETIYGVPNNNFNLNSKKPFLKTLTRKSNVPYLVEIDEVLEQKYLFDYLMTFLNERRNNIYIDDEGIKGYDKFPEDIHSGYFLRVNKGKEPEIVDCDITLKRDFDFKIKNEDIFNLKSQFEEKDLYKTYTKWEEYFYAINYVFYENCLAGNLFKSPKDVKLPKNVKITERLIIDSQKMWENLFFKRNDTILKSEFKKIGIKIIKNTLLKDAQFKACEQYNLYISTIDRIENRKEKKAMDIKLMLNSLNEKVQSEEIRKIETNEEYFFAIGQVIHFFIAINKTDDKSHFFVNDILKLKTVKMMKEKLIRLFKRYNYAIRFESKKFDNLFKMILAYECNTEKIDDASLIIGYLEKCVMFLNKEENE